MANISKALDLDGREGAGLPLSNPPPGAEESLPRLRNRFAGFSGIGLPGSSASENTNGDSTTASVPRGFLSVNGVA